VEFKKVLESVEYIKNYISSSPELGVILGSGLGDMADMIENKINIKYSDIPNFPTSTVKGHVGQFVFGTFMGKNVVMMQGRSHYYEGNPIESLSLPVYVMKYLGVKNLIVTNAAGGVNTNYIPGDLMIIKDHVNLSFTNPLIGKNDEEIGQRFPDMSCAYSRELRKIAFNVAYELNLKLQEGCYFMFSGPAYETPAEIKMVRILGGDAVGMSTVPEVIAARHCNINVLGISCITNMASGILNQPLNHLEVIETSTNAKDKFVSLLSEVIKKI